MADTQEFLDDLLHKLHGYDKGEVDILDGQIESTVQAILQHFQQEQERAKQEVFVKEVEHWDKEKFYTQSEVDRLIREAVSELHRTIDSYTDLIEKIQPGYKGESKVDAKKLQSILCDFQDSLSKQKEDVEN